MMFKRGLVAAVAAASLVSAPALAQSSASKLSVAQARAGASVEGEKLAGGALIGVLVFAAAVAIIYFVAEENDESESA
jgi:uncharacterized protein YdbL (DUF1318 family)